MTGSLKDWASPISVERAFSLSEFDAYELVVSMEGTEEATGRETEHELHRVEEPGKYVLLKVED